MSKINRECPFCGCMPEKLNLVTDLSCAYTDDMNKAYVKCPSCKATGPIVDFWRGPKEYNDMCLNSAITEWNNRQ